MSIEDEVVNLAAGAHRAIWTPCEPSEDKVSRQTKKAQALCIRWQASVVEKFGARFKVELNLLGKERGTGQKIDLVDDKARVAYELKASPNNVHMEIYRDVFKTLVFNERNPEQPIKTLVFIAPKKGILMLKTAFPKDVQNISARMGLTLKIRPLP